MSSCKKILDDFSSCDGAQLGFYSLSLIACLIL